MLNFFRMLVEWNARLCKQFVKSFVFTPENLVNGMLSLLNKYETYRKSDLGVFQAPARITKKATKIFFKEMFYVLNLHEMLYMKIRQKTACDDRIANSDFMDDTVGF